MSEIKYKVVAQAKAGVAGGTANQYYPRIFDRQKIDLRQIANQISKKSSFTTADVYGILEALTEEIPLLLMENKSIQLGDLGTFSLHIQAAASLSAQEVNSNKIKQTKVAFRPSIRLKKTLKQAQFQKV